MLQLLHKKIKAAGFWNRVLRKEDRYYKNCRTLLSTLFVPPSHFEAAIALLKKKIPSTYPCYKVIWHWLEKYMWGGSRFRYRHRISQYLGKLRTGSSIRTPVYHQDLWRMSNRISPELDRTNNRSERSHYMFMLRLRGRKPHLTLFFDKAKVCNFYSLLANSTCFS
jgi:hypothetical protein